MTARSEQRLPSADRCVTAGPLVDEVSEANGTKQASATLRACTPRAIMMRGRLVMDEHQPLRIAVECYAGHRGEQTPRTLILGGGRIPIVEVVDAWLAPEHRYFKLKGEDGDTYLVRYDERSGTWELTMFRAEPERQG